jgi:hypothetical protein
LIKHSQRRGSFASMQKPPCNKGAVFPMSASTPLLEGDLNRSTQHLLILLDKEVADGDVTDIVHGEAEG